MPIKNTDPFDNIADRLDAKINPYVGRLKTLTARGDVPVGYGEILKRHVGQWRSHLRFQMLASKSNVMDPSLEDPRKTDVGVASVSAMPLILEIGCHQGHTLVDMAQAFTQWGFIGIDITFKRVVTAGERAHKLGLSNVFCALANASRISHLFSLGELDGVVIFFPDPWTKKARQTKNQLINDSFVAELRKVLRPGGFVWLKTDQQTYAEKARHSLTLQGFSILDDQTKVLTLFGRDFTSTFERRFREQGLPTHTVIALSNQVST